MKVPEEIRKVERPKNTVVECTGKEGKNMYPVRERAGVKYVKGSNPQPHNGKVVGHIIDGKFVPVGKKMSEKAESLSYGAAAMIKQVSRDILDDLMAVYPLNYAYTIMAIAALQVERPNITVSRYASRYSASFLSEYYDGAALSQSSVVKLLKSIGMNDSFREEFFQKRISRLESDSHILIDGTLKENNSETNDLSHYTFKSKLKGSQSISVIYAYDLENGEPLCCSVYPGNHLDSVAYADFLTRNSLTKGIIIDDKGFPVKKIAEILKNNKGLHFLTPIKRNDTRIDDNKMLEFNEVIQGIEENVLAKKMQIKGGRYLYAFKDCYKASKELTTSIKNSKLNGNFNPEKFAESEQDFGTIVFESDLDISCKEAYECYASRWELELVFKSYKSELEFSATHKHGDFSVFGAEFINFISTLITRRIINKFKSLDLLKNDTYGNLMEDLSMAWRKNIKNDAPDSKDSNWVHANVGTLELMKKLGLCE